MQLYEIKEYLQKQHLDFKNSVEDDLAKLKQKAVSDSNELLANEIWCLQEIYKIQKTYVSMYNQLKAGKYFDGWLLLDRIDISFCFLRQNFEYKNNLYNLQFIERIIKQYEKTFPQYLYTSRESLIKNEKCSICGKKISLRGGCNHKPGNLYMGELCLREVTDFEFLGTAIVSKPFDRYAVIHIDGQEYDYSVLKELMKALDSPYIPWYVEELTKKRPEFQHVGRNDKCPCGSGKKYKFCCMGTDKEYMPHNRITILGGYEIKEKPIEYSGRFVSKKEN